MALRPSKLVWLSIEPKNLTRVVQLLKTSRALAESITLLNYPLFTPGALFSPADFNKGVNAVRVFSDILARCTNLETLLLDVNLIGGLFTLLDYVDPSAFSRVLRVAIRCERASPPHEILQLLMMMPNLRSCVMLPDAYEDDLTDEDIASFGPLHSDNLDIEPPHASIMLPLLLSRRWTANTVSLDNHPVCTKLLADNDWENQSTLPIIHLWLRANGRTYPPPVASFLVHACGALRVLRIELSLRQDIAAFLRPVLDASSLRLRHLALGLSAPPGSAGELRQRLAQLVKLLMEMPRGLTALHFLRITLFHNPEQLAPIVEDLIPFCRARRIRYTCTWYN